MTEQAPIDHVVILADESANWRIGGLRQLDRLVLALNEFAGAAGRASQIQVFVFWQPQTRDAWLPDSPQFGRVCSTESLGTLASGWFLVSTHFFVARGGLCELVHSGAGLMLSASTEASPENWDRLADQVNQSGCNKAGWPGDSKWRFIETRADSPAAEKQLLGGAGKPQDGLVSRFLNRPISRWFTRWLLKWPITPTAWTLAIFVLPVLSCLFLSRGNYAGFVIGTLLYHVHSVLDGCDGEIARAKYLESKRGGRIDDFCDMFGNFLFVIGLGWGLWSHSSGAHAWLYAAEGFLCAMVMATNEWLLRIPKPEPEAGSEVLAQALYPRHRQLVQRAGLTFLGERPVWLFVQLMKRDVGILFFILLALAGQAQWILHLSFFGPALTLSLSLVARFAPAGRRSVSLGTR